MTYLNCPRCGLSLRETRLDIAPSGTCPRCTARNKLDIPMTRSSHPLRLAGSIPADQAVDATGQGIRAQRSTRARRRSASFG
jgi:hypothetical protein